MTSITNNPPRTLVRLPNICKINMLCKCLNFVRIYHWIYTIHVPSLKSGLHTTSHQRFCEVLITPEQSMLTRVRQGTNIHAITLIPVSALLFSRI